MTVDLLDLAQALSVALLGVGILCLMLVRTWVFAKRLIA